MKMYSKKELIEEKYELKTLEEILLEKKPKKILVIKSKDSSMIDQDHSVAYETLIKVCEEEGIEVGYLTAPAFREYVGTTTVKDEYIERLESIFCVELKSEIYHTISEKLEAEVKDAELIVYIGGCPCCIDGKEIEELYIKALETFGSEKVYLGTTKDRIMSHAGSTGHYPYQVWYETSELSDFVTEDFKAEIQKKIDETPEKIKFLVIEEEKKVK